MVLRWCCFNGAGKVEVTVEHMGDLALDFFIKKVGISALDVFDYVAVWRHAEYMFPYCWVSEGDMGEDDVAFVFWQSFLQPFFGSIGDFAESAIDEEYTRVLSFDPAVAKVKASSFPMPGQLLAFVAG